MTLIERGIFDWAIQQPGPPEKQYRERNRNLGIVFHSGEGNLASLRATLERPTRQASWTGTIGKDGKLWQHYTTSTSIWASGSKEANTRFSAYELEGFEDEPANGPQTATILRIIRDSATFYGWEPKRRQTIWEHREVAQMWTPNAGPTACPSGRYDAVWDMLTAEDPAGLEEDMADPEARAKLDHLNEAIVNRERLRRLASDPDYTRVEKALELLKVGGMEL